MAYVTYTIHHRTPRGTASVESSDGSHSGDYANLGAAIMAVGGTRDKATVKVNGEFYYQDANWYEAVPSGGYVQIREHLPQHAGTGRYSRVVLRRRSEENANEICHRLNVEPYDRQMMLLVAFSMEHERL